MFNISPIGRNCNQVERDNFEKFDLVSSGLAPIHTSEAIVTV